MAYGQKIIEDLKMKIEDLNNTAAGGSKNLQS
jgi:hypothetical protein